MEHMADTTKMIPIGEGFDLHQLVEKLMQTYRGKGFDVQAMQLGEGVSVTFSKDDDGIKKYVGLALGIKANFNVNNGMLMVNFSDAEWTGKIIALAVGWFLCLIPFLIGIYGCIQQSDLPKKITNDIQMIVGGATPMAGQAW